MRLQYPVVRFGAKPSSSGESLCAKVVNENEPEIQGHGAVWIEQLENKPGLRISMELKGVGRRIKGLKAKEAWEHPPLETCFSTQFFPPAFP